MTLPSTATPIENPEFTEVSGPEGVLLRALVQTIEIAAPQEVGNAEDLRKPGNPP